MSGQLSTATIRAAVDALSAARPIASAHFTGVMHPYAAQDLVPINCPCGKPATHKPRSGWRLCDGCWFRYKVMKAAGRLPEFLKGLKP